MEQYDVRSGQTRPLKFVWDVSLSELRPEASLYFTTQTCVRFADVVTQEEYLSSAVRIKAGLDSLAVSSNAAKVFSRMNEGESKLDLVFHGTRSIANVDPILRGGMSPAKRKSNPKGEWFGRRLATPLSYAAERTVLVFLVILEKAFILRDHGGVVVHSNVAYQLPVAKVVVS